MTLPLSGTTHLSFTSRAPSIVVLGADTLLAALPASPVQLAHACLRAGFQHVIPASWGDELVAAAVVRALGDRQQLPAVQCSCPMVAHRLLAVGTELRPFLVSTVAPPVAIARYLRSLHRGTALHITYAGGCPAARDESIDARMLPDELLARFAERQITLSTQPQVFDSVIPPDRRRHISQPGGIPTLEAVWSAGGGRRLVELQGDELAVELAQLLLSDEPVLVDASAALGCVCSGSGAGGADVRRAQLVALEPPRSPTPIVDTRVPVLLEQPLPISPRQPIGVPAPEPVVAPHAPREPEIAVSAATPSTREGVGGPERELASTPTRTELALAPVTVEVAAVEQVAVRTVAAEPATAAPDEAVPAPPPVTTEVAQPIAAHREPEVTAAEAVIARGATESRHAAAPRLVLGELPMSRRGRGRQLPRTYVLHRRHSPRGVGTVEEMAAAVVQPVEGLAADGLGSHPQVSGSPIETLADARPKTPEASAVVGSETSADVRPEIFTETPPGESEGRPEVLAGARAEERAEAPTHAPRLPVERAPEPPPVETPVAERPVVPSMPERGPSRPTLPMMPLGTTTAVVEAAPRTVTARAPETRYEPPPRSAPRERAVQLPLERRSDGRTRERNHEAARSHQSVDAAPTQPGRARRRWILIALLVAMVALVSSAVGAALGAWYTSTRAQHESTR